MTQFDRLRAALAGRYDLGRELGAGGMATVYLATDVKHRRQVALKVLRSEAGSGLEAARFLREIEIAAGLVHPHILGVHDSGEADGLLFFVMPYVDGESLRQRLARTGRLPLIEVVKITRQIADALGHAHARGIVHRDIKPENILFESGHAVVADFGVARAVSIAGDATVTVTGVVVGTPVYMSPEQATGEHDLDARCDVYSLGCVAFEMLTGERPFPGATLAAVVAQKLTQRPPTASANTPGVSLEVDRALERAMATDRSARYATAGEFADALEAAASPAGGENQHVTRIASRRNWRSRRGVALTVTAAIALLAVSPMIWHRTFGGAPAVTALAVLPFTSPGADSAASYVVDGVHDEIITALGKVGSLRVISRTSVMVYRGARMTIPEIARKLNVGALVDGEIYRTGDSVRLQLRLVRAVPEEKQLWSRSYATRADNLQSLSADATRAIVGELRGALVAGDGSAPRGGADGSLAAAGAAPAVDARAFDAYLRGRAALNTRTADGIASAESELRRAIAIQPNFAAAHATLATALAMAVDWHYRQLDPIALSREAIVEANTALNLDSLSGEALAARGRILSAAHAPEALVRRDFERAIAAMPHNANAHGWYAMDLAWRGHAAESRAQDDTAIALDPLAPGRHTGFSLSAINSGDLENAVNEARRVVLLVPTLTVARPTEALALVLLGRARECLAMPLDRHPPIRAMCLRATGDTAGARQLVDSVARIGMAAFDHHGPYADMLAADMLAAYYAWVGDVDNALSWAERESRLTTATSTALYTHTRAFDAARRDPRYDAGVAKLHESIWQRVNTPPLVLGR